MRKWTFIIILACFLSTSANVFAALNRLLVYNKLVNVVNQTGQTGYFGICNGDTTTGKEVLCSIPQKLKQGDNRIFVPGLQKAYPFFTTLDEKAYACGARQEPTKQLFITLVGGVHTIVFGSFLNDSNGNKVAISCGVVS